jgi:hypothetical protein
MKEESYSDRISLKAILIIIFGGFSLAIGRLNFLYVENIYLFSILSFISSILNLIAILISIIGGYQVIKARKEPNTKNKIFSISVILIYLSLFLYSLIKSVI